MIKNEEDAKSHIGQLENDYRVFKKWTSTGFYLSIVFVCLGFIMLAFGIFGEYFGINKASVDLAVVSSLIIEFICGTAFFIFKYTMNRLNITSKKIQKTHLLYLEFKHLENLPEYEKNKRLNKLLSKIEKNYFEDGKK